MKLEKIISLANKYSELRFKAMVRSLRATGCDLPVWVIPYDDNKFELPENCIWWEIEDLTSFLIQNTLHPMHRKLQCFFTSNYQFVDADIVFLKDPRYQLNEIENFVASCCHWNNPWHTYVPVSLALFKAKSTTWQKNVFNAGQFACDRPIYTLKEIKQILLDPYYEEAVRTHDQMTLNLLVFLAGIPITNITLPPYNVESTWAGDYTDDDYEHYWVDESKKPYLIHWAGCKMNIGRPIDKLFLEQLTKAEQEEWWEKLSRQEENNKKRSIWVRAISKLKRSIKLKQI